MTLGEGSVHDTGLGRHETGGGVRSHLYNVVFADEGGRQTMHGAPVGGLLGGHGHSAGPHVQPGPVGRQ